MPLRRTMSLSLVAVTACAVAAVAPLSAASPSSSPTHAATTVAAAARPGSYTSHVFGTFGRAGTVRGQFVPERSFVRNGTTVVQGNLTATLRRASGALVGRVTRHDVTVPVKAPGAHQAASAAVISPAATCSILHLVLGPLNLNLLGLVVHLNRVVLDITAQSGPGNLLGNLLCAVANLLNNTSPSLLGVLRLSSLLSRITGLIT